MDKIYGKYDPDSSPYAWENVHKIIYTPEDWDFWNIFDFNNLYEYGKTPRKIAFNKYFDKYTDFNKYIEKVGIGGETDFNFKPEKVIYYLKMIVNQDDFSDTEKVNYTQKLMECNKKHHSKENFSLLLKNGALNNVKGSLQADRIDKFVYVMNDYFLHRDDTKHVVFSKVFSTYKDLEKRKKAIIELKEILKSYLDLFVDIYDYCAKIYRIDTSLVNDMLFLGGRNINNGKDVVEYMNLAQRFWEQKANALKRR